MKIGKSVVSFTLNISSCRYERVEDVPYWSLYSRPGDCLEDMLGHPWRSNRAITFEELKQYLESYPGRRLLNAYPRKSSKRRVSYEAHFEGNTAYVHGKWDKKLYATFVRQGTFLHNTYISPDAPSSVAYYRQVAAYEAWLKSIMTYKEYENNLPCKAKRNF